MAFMQMFWQKKMFEAKHCPSPDVEFFIEVRTSEWALYRVNVHVRISVWMGRERACYKHK
jgi:hypothetical protein